MNGLLPDQHRNEFEYGLENSVSQIYSVLFLIDATFLLVVSMLFFSFFICADSDQNNDGSPLAFGGKRIRGVFLCP